MAKVNYTKELMENVCRESLSISDVCRKLGLKPVGGNHRTVKSKIEQFNIDISHFTGQAWNKGLSGTEKASRIPLEDILKENTDYKSYYLRTRLVIAGLKEDKCELCGYNENLELHHINGDHYDNRLENLQILCPNCHSKTPNFRNRNQTNSNPVLKLSKDYKSLHYCICKNCEKEFYSDRTDKSRKFCSRECYNEYLQKLKLNQVKPLQEYSTGIYAVCKVSKEDLIEAMNKCSTITEIGELFGIHRGTARDYLKKYGLYEEFKNK